MGLRLKYTLQQVGESNMDIQTAAVFLTLIRLGSMAFITRVLFVQVPLLQADNDYATKVTQYILLALAVVIFFGNLIPVVVDLGTVFGDVDRSTKALNTIGVGYAFSNALTSLFSAGLVWGMYKLIEISNKRHEQ